MTIITNQQLQNTVAMKLYNEQIIKEKESKTRDLIVKETQITQDLINNYKKIELDVLMKQLSKLDDLKRRLLNSGNADNNISLLHSQLKAIIHSK